MANCNNNCGNPKCKHDIECVEKWCIDDYTALGPQFCCYSRRCAHYNIEPFNEDDRLNSAYIRISVLENKLKKAHKRISILRTELEFTEYVLR